METGIVKFYHRSKGYGFISPDNGDGDIFMHYTNFVDKEMVLTDGDAVKFKMQQGHRSLKAIEIDKLN